jgi:hypothetical protein
LYLRTARDLTKRTLLFAKSLPGFRIWRQPICGCSQHSEALVDVLCHTLEVLLALLEIQIKVKLVQFLIPPNNIVLQSRCLIDDRFRNGTQVNFVLDA